MSKSYILHDLTPEQESVLLSGVGGDWEIISARKAYARCKGCFGCWIKTPGMCVMHDGMETLGYKLATCDRAIVLSRGLYGGFSVEIKRLMDRIIPGMLPFFVRRNGEMHHPARYPGNDSTWKAYFYNGAEMTEQEKELIREILVANAINHNAQAPYEVTFLDNVDQIREVL